MAKAKAPAKRKSKALSTTDLQSALAVYANKDGSKIKVAESSQISIKGSKFSYQGGDIGSEINVVILAFVAENRFYAERYSEDNPVPPVCFAFEDEDGSMIPHEDSLKPQCDNCDECPHNEWESDPNGGNGKACGNRYRILIIDADIGENMSEAEHMAEAEVATINLPSTSINNWKKYMKDLQNKFQLPPFGVVTTLSFDEDIDHPVVLFNVEKEYNLKDKSDALTLTALLERRAEEEGVLIQPYDATGYDPDAGKKKKPAKKPANKKRR